MDDADSARPTRSRGAQRGPLARPGWQVRALVLGCLVVLLAGCGVHLDEAAHPPLTPTADEVARAATVADVVAVRDLASGALDGAGGTPPAKGAARTRLKSVVVLAGQQVEALGGVYDGPAPTATATPPTTTPKATVAAVVARLAANERSARARLAHVPDEHLARLVAQVGTSQGLSARALARAAGTAAPRPAAKLPAAVPTGMPKGARASQVATLVASEDGAGYALEVLAARASGGARSTLAGRAALHRTRAQAWADAAGISGTTGDPRQAVYAMPAKAATTTRTLESGLTTRYAALLDTLAPPARVAVADLLTDSARAAVDAGAAVTAFPGGLAH